jgi:hypothetical protein
LNDERVRDLDLEGVRDLKPSQGFVVAGVLVIVGTPMNENGDAAMRVMEERVFTFHQDFAF